MSFAPNTYALILHWRDGGSNDGYNVMHIENQTGSSMDDTLAQAITDIVDNRVNVAGAGQTAAWKSYINNAGGLNDVTVRGVDGDPFEFVDNTVILGTAATDTLPAQVSLMMFWRTGGTGRARRGRSYLPFFAEGFNAADGLPSSLLRADVQQACALLIVDLEAIDCPLVVASQIGTGTNYEVQSAVAGTEWRTQRRRINR